jgi:hypothetical protein
LLRAASFIVVSTQLTAFLLLLHIIYPLSGKADLQTVKFIRAAGLLFDVCTQFYLDSELPFDMEEKRIYAKVICVYFVLDVCVFACYA